MEEVEHDVAQVRLQELEAAVVQDVQQYGACSLSDKAKVQRLTVTIQDKLSQIRALTRDLELLFEELDSDEERQQVAVLLTRHKAEYERIQQAFKGAALEQRRRAVQGAAEQRKELLAGAADPAARQRALVAQAQLVEASEGVTEGLRRTRQVLAEQLDHTSTTLAAMEQSHAQLGQTKDEYHTQAGMLKQSKGLLGTLSWQQRAERIMMWVGLAVFFAVVAYIVHKRASHFVPAALHPSALLKRTTALVGGGKGSRSAPGSSGPPSPKGLDSPAGLPPHFVQREQQREQQQPLQDGLPPHFSQRQQQQQQQQPAPQEWDQAWQAGLQDSHEEQQQGSASSEHHAGLPTGHQAEWDAEAWEAPPPAQHLRPPAPPPALDSIAPPAAPQGVEFYMPPAQDYLLPPAPAPVAPGYDAELAEPEVHPPPAWDPAWEGLAEGGLPPGVAPPAAPQHFPQAPVPEQQAEPGAEQQGAQPRPQAQWQPSSQWGFDPVSAAIAGEPLSPPIMEVPAGAARQIDEGVELSEELAASRQHSQSRPAGVQVGKVEGDGQQAEPSRSGAQGGDAWSAAAATAAGDAPEVDHDEL
ncbi:hypothetical protein N2152v2_007682 [Parachlorella kessleri]